MRPHKELTLTLALSLTCLGIGAGGAADARGSGKSVEFRPALWLAQAPPAESAAQTGERQQGSVMPNGGEAAGFRSPMQEFVSLQVHEVGMLSEQIPIFRAAGQMDSVRMLYHMIRDHVLLSDAARNSLARRQMASRPVTLMTVLAGPEAMPETPEQIVQLDIQAHEALLERVRQLMGTANSDEERSIYQQAESGTLRHLSWLRGMNQGQPVRLGYFGPTTPLGLVASYRETIGEPGRRRVVGGVQGRAR